VHTVKEAKSQRPSVDIAIIYSEENFMCRSWPDLTGGASDSSYCVCVPKNKKKDSDRGCPVNEVSFF
jgi:hypothetical protein